MKGRLAETCARHGDASIPVPVEYGRHQVADRRAKCFGGPEQTCAEFCATLRCGDARESVHCVAHASPIMKANRQR